MATAELLSTFNEWAAASGNEKLTSKQLPPLMRLKGFEKKVCRLEGGVLAMGYTGVRPRDAVCADAVDALGD